MAKKPLEIVARKGAYGVIKVKRTVCSSSTSIEAIWSVRELRSEANVLDHFNGALTNDPLTDSAVRGTACAKENAGPQLEGIDQPIVRDFHDSATSGIGSGCSPAAIARASQPVRLS